MKNEKMTLIHSILFLVLIVFALVFFASTSSIEFVTSNRDIVDCNYTSFNLIVNTIMMIASIAIIEVSVISIRKLPKNKDDYNKALIIANMMVGTILNLFIIFWPIAQFILKCQ